jgi:hypothetical protein
VSNQPWVSSRNCLTNEHRSESMEPGILFRALRSFYRFSAKESARHALRQYLVLSGPEHIADIMSRIVARVSQLMFVLMSYSRSLAENCPPF